MCHGEENYVVITDIFPEFVASLAIKKLFEQTHTQKKPKLKLTLKFL